MTLLGWSMAFASEPWENPLVNEINRESMHAHFIPYINETAAIVQRKERYLLSDVCPPMGFGPPCQPA